MKSEQKIREAIRQLEVDNAYLLTGDLANVEINAPRALMQISVKAHLSSLYWVLGEDCPRYEYEGGSYVIEP